MFEKLLRDISKVRVALNAGIEENEEKIINTMIFGNDFSGDVLAFKQSYFKKLRLKERALLKIQEHVYNQTLQENEQKALLQEIENKLLKIQFLRFVYNTEAQKIDPKIFVFHSINIDFYNKEFFGVTQRDIGDFRLPETSPTHSRIYSRGELQKLIEIAKTLCPEVVFRFGKYSNFAHNGGVLKIPIQKNYNLQNIIVLFFHEMTHYFRTLNGQKNLGFAYQFSGYSTLEEGIAIYNEYLYGNKICDYGKFVPYYNMCLQIILEDILETEKKEKIFKILIRKGFDRDRSDQYYNRFYKYCSFGEKHVFLKDLIYQNGHKNVQKLIQKDSKNYDLIMAGDIGLEELKQGYVLAKNNFPYKVFFTKMVREIKKTL